MSVEYERTTRGAELDRRLREILIESFMNKAKHGKDCDAGYRPQNVGKKLTAPGLFRVATRKPRFK